MRATFRCLLALAVVSVALAGCGGTSNRALDASLSSLAVQTTTTTTSSTTAGPAPTCDPTASLRPTGSLPAPNAMPAGSDMARIQARGHLIVGVDQNTLLFAYFNPLASHLEGFEIDLVHELARAIFGDPDKVTFKVITTAERIPEVQGGAVDVVVDAMTMTCERRQLVDFSTVYYNAGQKLLVPLGSPIHGLGDLAGRRVCATIGSTSLKNIETLAPKAIPVPVAQRTDCLVALQQGTVDAVTSDDSILRGFQAQDPYTTVVGASFSPQPYGMAIAKGHPDFVRFVNAVLDRMRKDGTWQDIYKKWLGRFGPTPPPPTPDYSQR